jgi:hypothetical protein
VSILALAREAQEERLDVTRRRVEPCHTWSAPGTTTIITTTTP